jgi:hypothetical protein
MANIDNRFGFRPYQQILRVTPYYTTTTTVIGEGSVVEANAAGHVKLATNILASTGTRGRVVGIAAHFVSSAAAGVLRKVLVYDHPSQLFMVQASQAISRSAFFQQFSLTRTNGGANASVNRTTGSSKIVLANRSSTTANGFFRPNNWGNHIDQTTTAANCKVVGMINPSWHRMATVTGA